MEQVGFSGFTQQTFEFFMKIGFDNTPQHFEALRSEFNEVVLAPLKQLSLGVSPTLAKIDGRLDLRPVMGGTISRIRRDTRFSKNKAPYRTKMWLKFITKDPGMRLAFYFDLDPAGCVFGLGTSHSTPQEMTEKRRLGGPCYKRPPQTSEDPVLMELLARKYFYFEKPVSMETVYASSLVDTLAEGYTQLADFYHFFNKQS